MTTTSKDESWEFAPPWHIPDYDVAELRLPVVDPKIQKVQEAVRRLCGLATGTVELMLPLVDSLLRMQEHCEVAQEAVRRTCGLTTGTEFEGLTSLLGE